MYYVIPNSLILKFVQSVESVDGSSDSKVPKHVFREMVNFLETSNPGGKKPGAIIYKDLKFSIVQEDFRLKEMKLSHYVDILKEIIEGPKTPEYFKNKYFRLRSNPSTSLGQAIRVIRGELYRCKSSKQVVFEEGEYFFK